MNAFQIGDQVVVNAPRKMRWHGEPGIILGFCGPNKTLAVVQTGGMQPLFPIDELIHDPEARP